MKTFWTTFYSYKGGVGRSLALANVAALLVRSGHRVVLLDFDLEAPGLDAFDEFGEVKGKSGVVEYTAEFLKRSIAPDISSFVHEAKLPPSLRGKMWIMPAGRKDSVYNNLLSKIRWSDIYESGYGSAFVENWKAAIEKTFQPDYVFIDSRTGLTEIGGVCTTAFPDLVVMLFSLNEQSLEGTATISSSIRNARSDEAPQLHFVASPIPNNDKDGLLKKRLEKAEKMLGVKLRVPGWESEHGLETGILSCLHYWTTASLKERLFVLEEYSTFPTLVEDYKTLCVRIKNLNRKGLDFLKKQTKECLENEDYDLAFKLSEVLAKEFPNRPEALYLRTQLAKFDDRNGDPIELAELAFSIDPLYKPNNDFLHSYYQRIKQPEKIQKLYETILRHSDRLTPIRKQVVLNHAAELCMSLHKYDEATRYYDAMIDAARAAKRFPYLILWFNAAESSRRAGHPVSLDKWNEIIEMSNKMSFLDGAPASVANRYQAMHIPFALVGKISEARDCLKKAKQAAEAANDLEQIFTVKNYSFVNKSEFVSITDDFLSAIENGKLWDGTIL